MPRGIYDRTGSRWKELQSLAHSGIKDPNYGNIKENVTLSKLHEWVRRWKPKPDFCQCCGVKKPYDLANISGEYRRNISDFEWLCRSCHMHKDGRMKNLRHQNY